MVRSRSHLSRGASICGRAVLSVLLAWCGGCSVFIPDVDRPPSFEVSSVGLYLSKSSWNSDARFEQYKVTGNLLFVECGVIRGGRNIPAEQRFVSLKAGRRDEVVEPVWNVVAHSTAGGQSPESLGLPEPGDNEGFFDGGRAEFRTVSTSGSIELLTAFNAVSEPNSVLTEKLLELTRVIRGLPDEPACGEGAFFGIRAKKFDTQE